MHNGCGNIGRGLNYAAYFHFLATVIDRFPRCINPRQKYLDSESVALIILGSAERRINRNVGNRVTNSNYWCDLYMLTLGRSLP